MSKKRRGSVAYRELSERLSRLKRQERLARERHRHEVTNDLVSRYHTIVTEELAVKNMTASAKGDAESPGKNVKQKAGLNRSILDTAPASFLATLKYKMEEAGGELIFLNTRKLKPSQTCPACGAVEKKVLSERAHSCGRCGHTEQRDAAAARVMLNHHLESLKVAA